jgi:DNA transformation protein
VSLAADRVRALEIADRLRALGPVSVTTFFGGAGIRLDGVQFAFLIEGALYFRVSDRSRREYESLGAAPFTYAGKNKQVTVGSYYQVPNEIIDDSDAILTWAVKAREAANIRKPTTHRKSVRPRKRVRL